MRLQDVCKQTNLSKKAIYFYIGENLIQPTKDLKNGYYLFSEEDIKCLKLISLFRKSAMSIQSIKDIFKYPTMTNFFYHRQFNIVKNNIEQEMKHLGYINQILKTIDPNANADNLDSDLLLNISYKPSIIESQFPNIDARMIAIIIWAPFLDIEINEYRKFLWNKISDELELMFDENLIYLKRLIYQLSPQQINNTSSFSHKLYSEIVQCEDTSKYVDYLYQKFATLATNDKFQEYWITLYDNMLSPTLAFYQGKAHNLMLEFSDRYFIWSKKITVIIKNTNKKIYENPQLLNQVNRALNNKFNLGDTLYSDLLLLLTFDNGIFTQLPLNKMEEEILNNNKTSF